jgi:hypothetical protein
MSLMGQNRRSYVRFSRAEEQTLGRLYEGWGAIKAELEAFRVDRSRPGWRLLRERCQVNKV